MVLPLLVHPGAGHAAAGGDRLDPGEALHSGEWLASGGNTLVMQGDGNVVLYAIGNVAIWASNTNGHHGARLSMQSDGNLVVVAANGAPVWATGTNGRGASSLVMQGDGNVVIYAPTGPSWASNTYRQAYAVNRFPTYGWGADQWPCLNNLWIRESNWNELARNPSSGAHGIPQALPANKMAVEGSDYLTSPFPQIRWGENYIRDRYASPCGAWNWWLSHRWY